MATATHTTDDPSTRADVRARLAAVDRELAALAGEMVPERVPAHVVNRVVGLLGKIERRAGGARLVLTAAAAESGAWKAAGARSPEDHAAKQNGTSVGEAKADLKASHQLSDLPAARGAAASGDLSLDKAKAVAEGATADPQAERSLLDRATNGDLQDVRDEARRARQRADERDGKAAERMYQRRSLKTWLSLDGEGHGHWDVPPEYHAWFLAAIEPYRQEAFRLARESGLRPAPEALMADALFMLARDVLGDLDLPTPPAPPHRPDGQPDPTAPSDVGASSTGDAPTTGVTTAAGRSPDGRTDEAGDSAGSASTPPDQGSTSERSDERSSGACRQVRHRRMGHRRRTDR